MRNLMRNKSYKSMTVISIIAISLLFSSASAQQKQSESYDRAISEHTKAIEINPRCAEAYYNRGNAYQKMGRYDKAISDYTKALEMNTRFPEAYYNRGMAYVIKGQYIQAILDYTRVLEINPRDAVAYNNRGIVYYLRRQYEKSWEDIKKAQSLGYQIHPEFLNELGKVSGRQN